VTPRPAPQTVGILCLVIGNYLPGRDAAQDYPSQTQQVELARALQFSEETGSPKFFNPVCGGRMFQATAKSSVRRYARAESHVAARRAGNSCFRTWSTPALLDYFQNEMAWSASNLPDPSTKRDRNQHEENMVMVRAELQELLRRAYAARIENRGHEPQ